MTTVWRYQRVRPGEFTVETTAAAVPLSVQNKWDGPTMWMLVPDTTAPKIIRRFLAVVTGEEITAANPRFVGTLQIQNLVFHLFETT